MKIYGDTGGRVFKRWVQNLERFLTKQDVWFGRDLVSCNIEHLSNIDEMPNYAYFLFSIQRFCSSRDWGDYCEYIQRPGDPREYRSCVFTCTDHGCNGSNSLHKASSMAFLLALCMSLISKYF